MIMFNEDFSKPFTVTGVDGKPITFYPRIHNTTTNKSFIRTAMVLKKMNIKNYMFPLALYNEQLLNVNPHDPNLSFENKMAIMTEIRINPWYYFREVVRIPITGGQPIPYILNRANLALTWCYYNDVDVGLVQPRQTGKTIGTQSIVSHVEYYVGYNFQIAMLTKDTSLVQDNVRRLREIKEGLPQWSLVPNYNGPDMDRKEGLSYTFLKNEYKTFTNAIDAAGADKLGRGMTSPSQHWDEIAFFRYIWITFPAAVAATTHAAIAAAERGMPCANICTTTAGNPDTEPGEYAMNMFLSACFFNERLYDAQNKKDLHELVMKNSKRGEKMVYCVYSHRQLGYDDAWLRTQVIRTRATPERIDRDYLNLWKSSTDDGPIPMDLLDKMKRAVVEPLYVSNNNGYLINWYINEETFRSPKFRMRTLIAGLDTSEMIGRDYTTLTILDSYDMSVLATLRCNDSNVLEAASYFGKMMVEFSNMILIPECKSTGVAILDGIITVLKEHNINPWKRIFNLAVQKKDEQEFRDFNLVTETTDGLNKKLFGFRTTGGTGIFSRNVLYKSTMLKTLYLNAERIHDEILTKEFLMLRTKRGRIDHIEGGHDDMIISYLLACYFIFFAKNIHLYGIDKSTFLSKLTTEEDREKEYKKTEQIALRAKIAQLENFIRKSTSYMVKVSYENQLRELQQYINDEFMDIKTIATEQMDRDTGIINNIQKGTTIEGINDLAKMYAPPQITGTYKRPVSYGGYSGIFH